MRGGNKLKDMSRIPGISLFVELSLVVTLNKELHSIPSTYKRMALSRISSG